MLCLSVKTLGAFSNWPADMKVGTLWSQSSIPHTQDGIHLEQARRSQSLVLSEPPGIFSPGAGTRLEGHCGRNPADRAVAIGEGGDEIVRAYWLRCGFERTFPLSRGPLLNSYVFRRGLSMNETDKAEPKRHDIYSKVEHVTVRVTLIILLLIGVIKLLAQEVRTLPFWH